jgi:alpha-mannosidase
MLPPLIGACQAGLWAGPLPILDQAVNGEELDHRDLDAGSAPRCPDPRADQGTHRFSYALLPGAGIDATIAEGYALNLPRRVATGRGEPPAPLMPVDGDGATVEAVKLADDQSGDVIVRLHESLGGRMSAIVRPGSGFARAEITDLLERRLEDAPLEDGTIPLSLRPFQIVTLRLVRAA